MKTNQTYISDAEKPTVFETLRTYNGQIRALDLHLERLLRSWELIHSPLTLKSELELLQNIKQVLLKRNEIEGEIEGEKAIRIFLDPNQEYRIQMSPFDLGYVHRPLSVCSVQIKSHYPAKAKHTDRQAWQLACQKRSCDEVILCDEQYRPLESNNANIWALSLAVPPENILAHILQDSIQPLRGLIWQTPPSNGSILEGITRSALITIFQELGAKVLIEPLDPIRSGPQLKNESQIKSVYAYFLSSTLKSISWLENIDGERYSKPPFLEALNRLIDGKLSQF